MLFTSCTPAPSEESLTLPSIFLSFFWILSEGSGERACKYAWSRVLIQGLSYFKLTSQHLAFKNFFGILAAAAAAKSLQSCPTLCDPIDGSPPGSPIPGILQARTLEWVAISFSNAWKWKVKVKSLSCVRLFEIPSLPGSSVHGFFRQEYWSGLPLPSPK